MKNKLLSIEFNENTGNIKSIVINADPDKMNWCCMTREWGEVVSENRVIQEEGRTIEFSSFSEKDGCAESRFTNGKLDICVKRSFTESGSLKESYTFTNTIDGDVFLRRGDIGIYMPFPDRWLSADISQKQCSNTHVWAGGTEAWVNSLKQGISEHNIGVVVTKGAIEGYSIDRENQTIRSNTRGNIVVHPEPVELLTGESYTLEWEIFVHGGTDDFENRLVKYGKIFPKAERYTVYADEDAKFHFESDARDIRIVLDGEDVPFEKNGNMISVCRKLQKRGENIFSICADGKRTYVKMYSVCDFETILKRRIDFIVDNQQYSRPGSHVDGAYLIYDTKEKRTFYDKQVTDHNACRERLGMALLITRYLQTHENEKFYKSLMKWVEFMKREIVDFETGEVFNSEGKDHSRVRLYNAPWMITLLTELYNLTSDAEYLDVAYKAVKFYYTQGGAKFYPNGLSMKLTVDAFRKAGDRERTDYVIGAFKTHVQNMIDIGLNYPPMECKYEQTIVTSPATYICEMGLITGEVEYKEYIKDHLKVLKRFDGMQPDFRTNDMPIRYWDDYWFGKAELYADTLHYWSCLSARVWNTYYLLAGESEYRERALNCVENCFCLFKEDGSASCAYVLPFTVDGRDGDFYDEWANDQDFALYFALTIF